VESCPDRDLPPDRDRGAGHGGPRVTLAAAARLVLDAARKSRRPGEPMPDALARIVYSALPRERRDALASIFVRADAEMRGESPEAVVLRLAEELFL
jgi:hypothetical protein